MLEELADRLSFVRGEIVEDDVNLLPRWAQRDDLLQKGDELDGWYGEQWFRRGRDRWWY